MPKIEVTIDKKTYSCLKKASKKHNKSISLIAKNWMQYYLGEDVESLYYI